MEGYQESGWSAMSELTGDLEHLEAQLARQFGEEQSTDEGSLYIYLHYCNSNLCHSFLTNNTMIMNVCIQLLVCVWSSISLV